MSKVVQNKGKQGQQQAQEKQFNPSDYVCPQLSEEKVIELKEVFDLYDLDSSGSIQPKELQMAMQSLGYDGNASKIYSIIATLDTDKSGAIDFQEFVSLIVADANFVEDEAKNRKVFIQFTEDENKNTIDLADLRRVARELGETMDDNELREMIKLATGGDENGVVDFEQFSAVTQKRK